jgi:hypothetical protein
MIFKKVIPILILLVAIIFQKASSQSYVAFSSGFSIDLNNKKTFYHLPVILRMEPFKKSGFFIEGNYGIPFSRQGAADAYTTNPPLPEHVVLTETVRPYLFTISLGVEIHLYTNTKSKNSIYLDLSTGISSQHFKVNYKNYDNANYEVLNPDVSTDSSGLVFSIGCVYNFHKPKQDMFLMFHLQTPPLVSTLNYYAMTYKVIAPLQITFGYKLIHNKRK